jgi:hypothetical protein
MGAVLSIPSPAPTAETPASTTMTDSRIPLPDLIILDICGYLETDPNALNALLAVQRSSTAG